MMFTFKLLLFAYLMSTIVMYVVARSAIADRAWRFVFCFIGAVMPFVAAFVVIKNLIRPSSVKLNYVSDVAAVEDAIEAERVKIYGVEPLNPSFSERWKTACQVDLQRVVILSRKFTYKIKAIGEHWSIKPAA